jgi:nucleoside-diphosphate kinase
MAIERTLSILKPDSVEKNHVGEIIAMLEAASLRPIAIKRTQLTRAMAEGFYAVHRERKFFGELVEFMTRGPVVLMVLEGENAIARYREIMGATDPAKAAEGTIRKKFAANIGENATHGSDAPETAKFEIGWFFAGCELP